MNAFIDLNCDLGEGIGNDALIMPFISSANIACGFHAGDEATIATTIDLCLRHGVAIGAHPGFADNEKFGREDVYFKDMNEYYNLISAQLHIMQDAVLRAGTEMVHVKPHGALYNMSARDRGIAASIANAVRDFNPRLKLFGLAGSFSLSEAASVGIETVQEFFADRTYQADASLTPRNRPNAMIEEEEEAMFQAISIAKNRTIVATDGTSIVFPKNTGASICLHGDGKHAVEFATQIHTALSNAGFIVRAC